MDGSIVETDDAIAIHTGRRYDDTLRSETRPGTIIDDIVSWHEFYPDPSDMGLDELIATQEMT
jgi:hypothetical protein